MLPYPGYPTQPHDHLHYGAPHDDGPYAFPAAPFSGENADGTHAHYVQASSFGYGTLPHAHQQYAENRPHDLWGGSAAGSPVDGSVPFYDSPMADYTSLDQHYGGWQEGPHRSRRDSLVDPQLHHDHIPPVPAIARAQYADVGFHGLHDSQPAPYPIQPGFPAQLPLVARLELFDPTRGRRILTSPTESTYSELRHALTESPVSPSGSPAFERASRSPCVVEDLPPAFPRPTHSPSSELSHALDESQVGRAHARAPSPMMPDPPAEIAPRPESPPMDHLPWPKPEELAAGSLSRPWSRPQTPPAAPRRARGRPRQAAAAQAQDRVRLESAPVSVPLASAFQFVQDGVYPFSQHTTPTPLPFPLTARTSTDDLVVVVAPPAPGREKSEPSGLVHRTVRSRPRKRPRKKPTLACFFCRERKIACGPPPPGSDDPSCNQCARRNRPCEYPPASRRGQYKRLAALAEQERCDNEDGHGHDHGHDDQPGASASRG